MIHITSDQTIDTYYCFSNIKYSVPFRCNMSVNRCRICDGMADHARMIDLQLTLNECTILLAVSTSHWVTRDSTNCTVSGAALLTMRCLRKVLVNCVIYWAIRSNKTKWKDLDSVEQRKSNPSLFSEESTAPSVLFSLAPTISVVLHS